MTKKTAADDNYVLKLFAQSFIRDIDYAFEVRTEPLAEAFRSWFQLPPFPELGELLSLSRHLSIEVDLLPASAKGLPAANYWYESPTIVLREDLSTRYAETSFCHELREVLETTFKRVKPSYAGLDTSDNRVMDPKSERFASALLMQADATDARLAELGFDLPQFAQEKGRSLPSVVLRAQYLYSKDGSRSAPFAGVWLFDAPWEQVQQGEVHLSDLRATYRAHLAGFSMDTRQPRGLARLASAVFPRPGAPVVDYQLAVRALTERRTLVEEVGGFDLFDRNFVVAAEPFFVGGLPWRVLVAAIRKDCLEMVAPWLDRLWPHASRALP
jgi:hypothetical protein